eukprot:scaffold1954_cov268-Pinguiococcus_pyrenoidosus.AAC.284
MFLPSLPGSRKLKGKRSSYKVSSVLHRPVLHDAGVRAMMDDDGDDAAITADVEPDESQTTFMGRLRSVLNDRVYRTLQEISVVLSFQSFVVSIYNSVKRKERFGVLFSILYGVIEWLAYVRQTSWPRFPSLLRTSHRRLLPVADALGRRPRACLLLGTLSRSRETAASHTVALIPNVVLKSWSVEQAARA